MQRAGEIPAFEDNRGFQRRLMVSMLRKKGLVNRLQM